MTDTDEPLIDEPGSDERKKRLKRWMQRYDAALSQVLKSGVAIKDLQFTLRSLELEPHDVPDWEHKCSIMARIATNIACLNVWLVNHSNRVALLAREEGVDVF